MMTTTELRTATTGQVTLADPVVSAARSSESAAEIPAEAALTTPDPSAARQHEERAKGDGLAQSAAAAARLAGKSAGSTTGPVATFAAKDPTAEIEAKALAEVAREIPRFAQQMKALAES